MTMRQLLTTLACTFTLCTAFAQTPVVTLEQARAALESASAVVIDIREPSEHATGVAQGTKLIPMSQLSKRISEVPKAADAQVLLICNTQNRSSRMADQLRAAGYTNISYVNGGMSQWAARGWPMVKP
jgi:rhodanese-related sulfurtransferase